MTADTVSCHVCGHLLGTINQGDQYARARGQTSRIVTAEHKVRIFVDLAMTRIEVLCPNCGAIGRTLRSDRIRGFVLNTGDAC